MNLSGLRKGRPAITYSPTTVVAVPSAQGRLTSVFGMGTGGTTPLTSPAKVTPLPEGQRKGMRIGMQLTLCCLKDVQVLEVKPIGQLVLVSYTRCRASTPSLSTSWSTRALGGELVLRGASHLDAFSGYPVRTWLPCSAAGATTGTPEVRPSRSSRTEDSSSQFSSAHRR